MPRSVKLIGANASMKKSPTQRPAHYSESLARGLQVLRAFDRDAPRLRVRDVAERSGLNRAAARRFLLTLRDLGYVASENDIYFLRPRVLDLGYSYLSSANIRGIVQPLLDELAERTRDATTLAVLDETEALIIARACKRPFDLAIGSGSRLPLDKTALGHVLLAALPRGKLDSLFKRSPKLGGSAADREALRRRLGTRGEPRARHRTGAYQSATRCRRCADLRPEQSDHGRSERHLLHDTTCESEPR